MADENDPDANGSDRDKNVEHDESDSGEVIAAEGNDGLDVLVQEAANEYVALDTTLNQIDSYLSVLEQKNDDLYQKAQELLESSRQTRLELQKVNEEQAQSGQNPENKDSAGPS